MANLFAWNFSYDPDFAEWEFGKLSAMREIALAIEGGYQYYYMGTATLISNNVVIGY